jgi:ATP-dependent Clp protease ATP-binding subunit ClpB
MAYNPPINPDYCSDVFYRIVEADPNRPIFRRRIVPAQGVLMPPPPGEEKETPQAPPAPPDRKLIETAVSMMDTSVRGIKAVSLRHELQDRVIGQAEAIDAIVDVYQSHLAGLTNPGAPIGNFLFLGPTGTGKTHLVESAAEVLLGNKKAMLKINCAEFQHSHEIAKLVGSPPGYLGHKETSPLFSQTKLDQYHTADCKISFVLFDEIEKASDSLWTLLLGILDKGELTLGTNVSVDFTKVMIFLTSNIGAREIKAALAPGLGFAATGDGDIRSLGLRAVKKRFSPEFVNRLENIVTFDPLNETAMTQILELELKKVGDSIASAAERNREFPFTLEYTPAVKDFLIEKGFDRQYGARNLQRIIRKHLGKPLANLIASRQTKGAMVVYVEQADGELVFSKLAEVARKKQSEEDDAA